MPYMYCLTCLPVSSAVSLASHACTCVCVCLLLSQAVSSDDHRRELFAAYAEALRQVAEQRAVKAEAELMALLVKLKVGPESNWDEVGLL